jgi:hypothetical protein
MASNLDGILDALEAMSITGYSYTVLRGSTLKNVVDIATTPCRIISAIGIESGQAGQMTPVANGVVRITWTITDSALMRPASLGIGLSDIAPAMEGYVTAYHDALRSLHTTAHRWTITEPRLRSQILEWPAASGQYFDAVVATLSVVDIIQ